MASRSVVAGRPSRPNRLARLLPLALIASATLWGQAYGAARQPALTLTPKNANVQVGTAHTVTAHLSLEGEPLSNDTIRFVVTGANPTSGQAQTNAQGDAQFSYTGENEGDDDIEAYADIDPPNGQQDTSEPVDNGQAKWDSKHTPKDPRKDDWPTLTEAERKTVKDLMGAGLNKRADTLAKLVEILKNYCCNFDQMAGGAPTYDAKVFPQDGITQREKGGKVVMGRSAFKSVAWLYSSLKHEMVHSAQWQDPKAAERMGANEREKEAYKREVDQKEHTGLSKAEVDLVKAGLKQFTGGKAPIGLRSQVTAQAGRSAIGRARAGLRLSISLAADSYATGDPIPLRLTIRNVSNHPITVNRRFLVNDSVVPAYFRDVAMRVEMPGGGQAPFGWDVKASPPKPGHFLTLQPGQGVTTTRDVAFWHVLAGPGTYSVSVLYRSVHDGGAKTRLRAGPATFSIA